MGLLYLFLITLFIRPQDWLGSPLYGLPLNDYIVLGALMANLFNKARNKSGVSLPQNYLLVAYLVIIYASNFFNGNQEEAVLMFLNFTKRALIYIIFLLQIDTKAKLNKIFLVSTFLTVILSFQGIYQSIYGIGWAKQTLHSLDNFTNLDLMNVQTQFEMLGRRTYWIGLWDGPNVLCLAYLMTVPFTVVNLLNKRKHFFFRLFNLICFIFLCVGVYLTNSRGGYFTLGIILLPILLFRLGLKKGLILAVILFPLFIFFSPSRMALLNTEEESAHERTWLWEQGLNMYSENKLLGIGKGQFADQAGLVAHNNYVASFAETGFLGLFVYLGLIYFSLKTCLVVFSYASKQNNYSLIDSTLKLAPAILGFFTATFFVLMEHDIMFIYWALPASLYKIAKKEHPGLKMKTSSKDFFRIFILAVGMIFLVWLIAEKEIFG